LAQTEARLDRVRALLVRLVAERGTDFKAVSLAIGKNHAYLHQFVRQHRPPELPDDVRQALARHFKLDPRVLASAEVTPARPIDRDLLARANHAARTIVGGALEDEEMRVDWSAAFYSLLETNSLSDDPATLRIFEALHRRLVARGGAGGPK
jgi:hypothetical protein